MKWLFLLMIQFKISFIKKTLYNLLFFINHIDLYI